MWHLSDCNRNALPEALFFVGLFATGILNGDQYYYIFIEEIIFYYIYYIYVFKKLTNKLLFSLILVC